LGLRVKTGKDGFSTHLFSPGADSSGAKG